MRKGGTFKNDAAARSAWGKAYDEVPKSVFALVAWHLCNLHTDDMESVETAEARAIQEIEMLRDGNHLSRPQADRAIKAIRSVLP